MQCLAICCHGNQSAFFLLKDKYNKAVRDEVRCFFSSLIMFWPVWPRPLPLFILIGSLHLSDLLLRFVQVRQMSSACLKAWNSFIIQWLHTCSEASYVAKQTSGTQRQLSCSSSCQWLFLIILDYFRHPWTNPNITKGILQLFCRFNIWHSWFYFLD